MTSYHFIGFAKRSKFEETNNARFQPFLEYPKELREFAVSLHNTSAAAYRYVREEFGNILPSETTIRKWMGNIDGSPGFSKQVPTYTHL